MNKKTIAFLLLAFAFGLFIGSFFTNGVTIEQCHNNTAPRLADDPSDQIQKIGPSGFNDSISYEYDENNTIVAVEFNLTNIKANETISLLVGAPSGIQRGENDG